VETDLGEYIIQLAKEPPSHIIAPAIHKSRQQIADLFHAHHAKRGFTEPLETPEAIVNEARTILRNEYVRADVGITGANLLIAQTGSTVLVTNEGNGDLTASLPKVHIVVASIEKVVPTLEDATVLLRLLARSATGQEMTSYTTFFTGPKQPTDLDGPEQFHVVLVDNHRTEMLANQYRDMLRCIHCGACLNHCPVYSAIGGHAYGWVYPGPMGSVLTPLMMGLKEGYHLPQASTFCGRCEEVCPLSIPLPTLLREHRFQIHQQHINSSQSRWALAIWGYVARRPRLYQWLTRLAMGMLHLVAGKQRRFRRLLFANAWTRQRDFPAPQRQTFMSSVRSKHDKEAGHE
jgi:L-lactate dehydrogenase complex protein LldF